MVVGAAENVTSTCQVGERGHNGVMASERSPSTRVMCLEEGGARAALSAAQVVTRKTRCSSFQS